MKCVWGVVVVFFFVVLYYYYFFFFFLVFFLLSCFSRRKRTEKEISFSFWIGCCFVSAFTNAFYSRELIFTLVFVSLAFFNIYTRQAHHFLRKTSPQMSNLFLFLLLFFVMLESKAQFCVW